MASSVKLEKIFTTRDTLDKRFWFYPHLKKLHLVSINQLQKKCISKDRFIPLFIEGITPGQLESLNYTIALEFTHKKLISKTEANKLLPLSCYTKSLSKRTRKACANNNIHNLGDVIEKCLKRKNRFTPIRLKGFTTTANHQLAVLLHRKRLINDKALFAVERPSWMLLVPTYDQIGSDGETRLCTMSRAWNERTKDVICRAVTIKFRHRAGALNPWETISIEQLVMTFVRIDTNNNPIFYTKNRSAGPYSHIRDFFDEHGPKAYPEIQKFLEDMNYLVPLIPIELD